MSEGEFDSYLSLLSKFLRLSGRQRGEFADELNDHLESRLGELLAEGMPHEAAVRAAVEEFGDAAVLADRFARLASRRKRRFVMRTVTASAAVVAAVVLLSLALAPPGPVGVGPENVVAQPPGPKDNLVPDPLPLDSPVFKPPANAAPSDEPSSIEQQAVAELDRKLGQVVPEVEFKDVPLREAIAGIADANDADVLLDEQAIADEDVSVEDPVRLSIARTQVSARTVLDFLLKPKGLAFVNRAGVIFVTTRTNADELLTTRVYNVRDLLASATAGNAVAAPMTPGGAGMPGGAGVYSVSDHAAAALLTGGLGQFAGGGMGGGGMGGMPSPPLTGPAGELVATVRQVTSGPWMETDGAGGTLAVFNGLLVVRQTDQVHAEIQKLLDALREAGRGEPGESVTVPKQTASTF